MKHEAYVQSTSTATASLQLRIRLSIAYIHAMGGPDFVNGETEVELLLMQTRDSLSNVSEFAVFFVQRGPEKRATLFSSVAVWFHLQ